MAARNWSTIKYANGYFLAITSNSLIGARSQDGAVWEEIELPFSYASPKLQHVNGAWWLFGKGSSTTVERSKDNGLTWESVQLTSPTLSTAGNWIGVAYINGKFIFGSSDLASLRVTSDFVNFESIAITKQAFANVVKVGNTWAFCLTNPNNASSYSYFLTSTDGVTWKEYKTNLFMNTAPIFNTPTQLFVSYNKNIYRTSDFVNWENVVPPGITNSADTVGAIANVGETTVALYKNKADVYQSLNDGITWERFVGIITPQNWSAAAADNERIVAVANNSNIASRTVMPIA
ncbi:MAG: hypothetical protein LBH98_08815 [Chitinispirillales bacterium]|jgi:hypothetical protein|nr:hypothetical protein [Chitinispirillales bacterium]